MILLFFAPFVLIVVYYILPLAKNYANKVHKWIGDGKNPQFRYRLIHIIFWLFMIAISTTMIFFLNIKLIQLGENTYLTILDKFARDLYQFGIYSSFFVSILSFVITIFHSIRAYLIYKVRSRAIRH